MLRIYINLFLLRRSDLSIFSINLILLNCFTNIVKCYGKYINLNKIDQKSADQNALLVLQNIKVKGFNIGDRANGFNKHDTEAILEVCALFVYIFCYFCSKN